ncbi:zinc-ribbon domain-containing protein [Lacibacterium aquatile]|uniref:Zinc-ribbon domain-containing protein n=1 Tax=Lacibacterium aquatile TaxID=1168082 RepID=A0ABW5DMV2_9PROT
MAHLPLREPDEDLIPLLRKASSEDLGILVEYIHKDFNQDLNDVPDFKLHNPRAGEKIYEGDHRIYADDIAAEIQRYGGNSFSNAFRGGKGVPYIEVLRDVADSLKVNYSENSDAATIESQIQLKVLEKAYEKMDDKEKSELLTNLGVSVTNVIPAALPMAALQTTIRMSGFAAYKMAAIIANAVAKILIGRGLTLATSNMMMKGIKMFAGPVGWAITAIWTLVDLAGPAYRVTIPCVIQIAYIRQHAQTHFCPKCESPNTETAKFCQSCGTSLQSEA